MLMRSMIAIMLLATSTTYAAGWVKILKDSPAEVFEEDDLRLLLEAARRALDAEGDTETVKWANEASGAGGSFKVLSQSTSQSGALCKRVRLTMYAKVRSEKAATLTACRGTDFRWKIGAAK